MSLNFNWLYFMVLWFNAFLINCMNKKIASISRFNLLKLFVFFNFNFGKW